MDKTIQRCLPLLDAGEQIAAAVKVLPRGAAHEAILGAAGAVAGGTLSPIAAGAGGVLGHRAGAAEGEAGRSERAEADLHVGSASQVLLAVTDRRVALFELGAFGKPKELAASLGRDRIKSVEFGETKLFGQKMGEIVIGTDDGSTVGFGVAKVHRRQGEEVVAALG
ncbi:MAG: hypothetical protein GY708_14000 [Actinomycetia bacterium]|nr:hypothetical protein [Actinomycetes bacterium]MCP4959773.1 hypothetical protein [Actinomycetes bacterium]